MTLTEMERIKALASQLVKLLRSQKDSSLLMPDLLTEYSKTFGYSLRLHDYDVSSVPALMQKLCHVVKVTSPSDVMPRPFCVCIYRHWEDGPITVVLWLDL